MNSRLNPEPWCDVRIRTDCLSDNLEESFLEDAMDAVLASKVAII